MRGKLINGLAALVIAVGGAIVLAPPATALPLSLPYCCQVQGVCNCCGGHAALCQNGICSCG